MGTHARQALLKSDDNDGDDDPLKKKTARPVNYWEASDNLRRSGEAHCHNGVGHALGAGSDAFASSVDHRPGLGVLVRLIRRPQIFEPERNVLLFWSQ